MFFSPQNRAKDFFTCLQDQLPEADMVDFPVFSAVVLTLLCLSSSLEMPYSSYASRRYPSAGFTRLGLISWLLWNVLLYCWILNYFFHFLVSLMSLWIHRSLHDLWDTIGLNDDGVSNSVFQYVDPLQRNTAQEKEGNNVSLILDKGF